MPTLRFKPAPYNPRKITDESLESLAKAMEEFGDLSGIVKNIRTGNLIGGHQRIKVLQGRVAAYSEEHKDSVGTVALGHIETPFGRWQYREVDWTEEKEMLANIAANKHGGEWDYPKLKDILCELDNGATDIALTGFDNAELKRLIDHETPQPEELREVVEEEKTCKNCGEPV